MGKNELGSFFNKLLLESKAYSDIENIQSLVETKEGLQSLPVQPLYFYLKRQTIERTSELIPALSKEQRQAILDIDLWSKDDLDVKGFDSWLAIFDRVSVDDIKTEFLKSSEFALFLKGRFNISTFDKEDPQYPEHEHFFLTDDDLLLIEYEENFPYAKELQEGIRFLYYQMGVEKAYSYLFKLTVDSFSSFQEDEYRNKKERLRDYGFVDYFDALEFVSAFPSESHIHYHVKTRIKENLTPAIDLEGQNQILHHDALIPYEDKIQSYDKELFETIEDGRIPYLKFNFLRLINGSLELDQALKSGRLAMNRTAKKVMHHLDLGIDFVKTQYSDHQKDFFNFLDFVDLYKIGFSLISLKKSEVNKALRKNGFLNADDESFFGAYLNNYLDSLMQDCPKLKIKWGEHELELESSNMKNFESWKDIHEFFIAFLPFVSKFKDTWFELKENESVRDEFYLNYAVDEVDFEAILLSSFICFDLEVLGEGTQKLALTVKEFQTFYKKYFDENGELKERKALLSSVQGFAKSFGLDEVHLFDQYLIPVIDEQTGGYKLSDLSNEEYKHIGGPILLNEH